jgi:hypothetical protein
VLTCARRVCARADTDGDGQLSYEEFARWWATVQQHGAAAAVKEAEEGKTPSVTSSVSAAAREEGRPGAAQ